MPALGPLGTGVEATDHVRPRSRDVNTRDELPPPVAKYARPPAETRHVPLAAKANSPVSAGGIPTGGRTFQLRPPSDVARMRNLPSTGSDSANPCRALTNVMQS